MISTAPIATESMPGLGVLRDRLTSANTAMPSTTPPSRNTPPPITGPSPLSVVFTNNTRHISIYGQVRDLRPQRIESIRKTAGGFTLTFTHTDGSFKVNKLTRSTAKKGWALTQDELDEMKGSSKSIYATVDARGRLVWLSDTPDPSLTV